MALGLCLQVSWIYFLLFSGCVSPPAIKDYRYQNAADYYNLMNGEDILDHDNPFFEKSNTGLVFSYDEMPSAPEQPESPSDNFRTVSPAIGLINAQIRDWGLSDHDGPITFPLRPNYQPMVKHQSGLVHPQSSAVNTLHVDSSENEATPNLHYEEVFLYPSSEGPEQGGYGGVPDYDNNMHNMAYVPAYGAPESEILVWNPHEYVESHVAPASLNVASERPSPQVSWNNDDLREAAVLMLSPSNPQEGEVFQGQSDPTLPLSLPPSFIVQSRNGYQRGRVSYSKTRYVKEPPQNISPVFMVQK